VQKLFIENARGVLAGSHEDLYLAAAFKES
jgi:hypothetical protein